MPCKFVNVLRSRLSRLLRPHELGTHAGHRVSVVSCSLGVAACREGRPRAVPGSVRRWSLRIVISKSGWAAGDSSCTEAGSGFGHRGLSMP